MKTNKYGMTEEQYDWFKSEIEQLTNNIKHLVNNENIKEAIYFTKALLQRLENESTINGKII